MDVGLSVFGFPLLIMRPNINVLENGIAVTREMTEAEYAEYEKMLEMAQNGEE